MLFFFILAPRFDLGISVHAGYFSFLLIALSGITHAVSIVKRLKSFILLFTPFLIIGLYNLFLAYYYENNGFYFTSIMITASFSVMYGWLFAAHLAKTGLVGVRLLDKMLEMILYVAVLNSLIIIAEYSIPGLKNCIEGLLLQVDASNIDYANHPFRLRGISSAGGAGLSVFNACALLLLIHLSVYRHLSSLKSLTIGLIIASSNIFTGRTGLIVSLLLLALLILVVILQKLSHLRGWCDLIVISVFITPCLSYLAKYELESNVLNWAFEWVDSLYSGSFETTSSEELKDMLYIPDNLFHSLLGIGFFEGNGGIYPRSDSGYVKTILSIGIPLSLFIYFYIFYMFCKILKVSSKYKWFVIGFVCLMLVLEIKEPFIYQNFAGRFIFLLSGASLFISSKKASYQIFPYNFTSP